MKFSDGNWMMQPGVRAHYASEAYDVEDCGDTLRISAATRPIRHRGDTLEGPLLTVNVFSPMPDVIGVQCSNWIGTSDPGPHFPVDRQATDPEILISDQVASFTSGNLSLNVNRSDWKLEFSANQQTLTGSPSRGMGLMQVNGAGPFSMAQLNLGVGENVYGLGERFTSFVKNGQVVEIWNRDGGTGSDQAYKNVPFYLTNRGYGVFVNHSGNVSFEVASEKVSRVQFSVPGQSIEYFVIYGPTPAEILKKYTALTGRSPLPPAWSFGLWLTTSFTTNYNEETCTEFIQGMEDRDLPLHVFHFDCFWMREFNWCDFQWDPRTFPDPKGMLSRLKERGLHICVWINPYIAQRSPLFAEGMKDGYFLKNKMGGVWQTEQWQPGMAIVDFTNPSAVQWYGDKLRTLVDMGVDCFKTDFGERIPTDVTYFDGSDPERMHNFYPYLYNQTVFEVLEQKRGKGEATLFARSATAGCQKFPVHWGGDCNSNFESMAESLRGGLSLCLSGFGFWSHDIGGFEGTPPVEVYKRWIAFGLMSTHSRLHGSTSYRVPWVYDTEAVDVLRRFTKLKCSLMPYLFAQAIETSATGVPMMRAMMLEFPSDPSCDTLDRQYMLGDSLMIAPVLSQSGSVDYYVPKGRWTNLLDGSLHVGPTWIRENHGFLTMPILVRPNTLLAIGSHDDRPDYAYNENVHLHLFELADGSEAVCKIPNLDGTINLEVQVKRAGQKLQVNATGIGTWDFNISMTESISEVRGGTLEATTNGYRIQPSSNEFEIIFA